MADFPVVDVHTHTYPSASIGIQSMGGQPRVPGYTGLVDELADLLEREGWSHACMLNFTPVYEMLEAGRRRLPPDLTPEQRAEAEEQLRETMRGRVRRRNDWTLEVARQNPRLVPFIGVDPVLGEDGMHEEVARCARAGAKGVKIHPFVQRVALDDRAWWPLYESAQAHGLAILTHAGPFLGQPSPLTEPRRVAAVLRDFPDLQFILAHAQPGDYLEQALALLEAFPGLSFDICYTIEEMDDDTLTRLIRALGVHRVMYGSDWPWFDPVPQVQRIARLPSLSRDEKRLVLGDNARRLLGLG